MSILPHGSHDGNGRPNDAAALYPRSTRRLAYIVSRALCTQPLNGEVERLVGAEHDLVQSLLAEPVELRRATFDAWLAEQDEPSAKLVREAVVAANPLGPDPDAVATLADVSNVLGDIEWLWQDWWPKGFLTLFVAEQGIGKSLLAIWGLGRVLLLGGVWPDGSSFVPPSSRPLLWCEAESAHQLLVERAELTGLPFDRIIFPTRDPFETTRLDNTLHIADLRETVRIHKPAALIYDALSGGHGKRENSSDEMLPVIRTLADLARDYQLPVLLIHHVNKQFVDKGKISLNSVRGASAITQLARVVWALEKVDNSGSLRLRVIKSNLGKMPNAVGVRIADDHIEYGKAPQPKKHGKKNNRVNKLEQAKALLREQLAGGSRRASEILEMAQTNKISERTLERAKDDLNVAAERVGAGEGGHWIWSLPDGHQDQGRQ
jgi:hypothetical protein